MTAVPAAAITAAAQAWHDRGCAGKHDPDHWVRIEQLDDFRVILEAAAPPRHDE